MKESKLPVGKLPGGLLEKFLKKYSVLDSRVVLGPGIGEDACAIDFKDRYLIAKTDPITFVASDIGAYALAVNSNDISTRGAVPKWFLGTLLLPEKKTTPSSAEKIFAQVSRACRRLKISLVGGHAEVTYGLDRPILIGFLLGEVSKKNLIRTSGARPGDDVLLTKGIPLEAASILAREKERELLGKYSPAFLRKCRNLIRLLSVSKEALEACRIGGVHSLHDPTEGGLSTGLYEVALAAKLDLVVEKKEIPVIPEAEALCKEFGLNPLGAIASGALLICCDPKSTQKILKRLKELSIKAKVIGKALPGRGKVWLRDNEKLRPFPEFKRDEIAKILGK